MQPPQARRRCWCHWRLSDLLATERPASRCSTNVTEDLLSDDPRCALGAVGLDVTYADLRRGGRRGLCGKERLWGGLGVHQYLVGGLGVTQYLHRFSLRGFRHPVADSRSVFGLKTGLKFSPVPTYYSGTPLPRRWLLPRCLVCVLLHPHIDSGAAWGTRKTGLTVLTYAKSLSNGIWFFTKPFTWGVW